MRSRWSSPLLVLQLITGLYLIALGISGIAAYTSQLNEFARTISRAFGGSGSIFPLLVAILEVVAGALLLWALFGRVEARVLYVSTMVLAALWVLRVLLFQVFDNLLEPNFIVWLAGITGELIPGLVIWTVGRHCS